MKGCEKPGDGPEDAADVRRSGHWRAYFLLGSGLVLIPVGVVAIIARRLLLASSSSSGPGSE